MAAVTDRDTPDEFQSSPASKGGCYDHRPGACCCVAMFQSSPASKGGCYWQRLPSECLRCQGFNPHPPRRAGATAPNLAVGVLVHRVSILTRLEGRVLRSPAPPRSRCRPESFNPHPPRRAGATRSVPCCDRRTVFQSSPASKGGCYAVGVCLGDAVLLVSILTRLEGRVLRCCWYRPIRCCQSFNPHPPRRAGATCHPSPAHRRHQCFNPHPPRRAGATGSLVVASDRQY